MDYPGVCKRMSSQEITTDAGEIEDGCQADPNGEVRGIAMTAPPGVSLHEFSRQDEIAGDSSPHVNRGTPLLSLDVPIIGDHGDIKEDGDSIVKPIIGERITLPEPKEAIRLKYWNTAWWTWPYRWPQQWSAPWPSALIAAPWTKTPPRTILETEKKEALARDRGGDANMADRQNIKLCADNMVEDGLIKIVPLLKDDKFMDGDTHVVEDGGEVPLDARKPYEPGGCSPVDTKITGCMTLMGARLAYRGEAGNVTKEGRENFRMKVIKGGESDTPESSPTTINLSCLQITSCERDATRSPRGSWSPMSTEHGTAWDVEEYARTELLRQSMSDYRSMRSIPPFTMKSWLNHKFATNYMVGDASQSMEAAPRVTEETNEERKAT